jgi:hypothetical protein
MMRSLACSKNYDATNVMCREMYANYECTHSYLEKLAIFACVLPISVSLAMAQLSLA